jgi:threonine aldolase
MRAAMATAEVGDDVLGEDPTVRGLEEEAAEAMGCEASLFVPSGTMGNQIALHLHRRSGGEVLCESRSHVLLSEMGAMAALSGMIPKPIVSADGRLDPAAVEAAIAPEVSYRSRTAVLVVENTHNFAGGRVSARPLLDALLAVARRHGLPAHLDGARVFNAAEALAVEPSALAQGFDSVMFCLSKGLGAPVGSMLCGSRTFVHEARRVRKMLGGGMRQVGVLAAAGLVALREGPARLAADHANARWLADELAALPTLDIDPAGVETNILVFRVKDELFRGAPPAAGAAAEFLIRLRAAGVLASPVDAERVRLVTHRDAPRKDVEIAARRIAGAALPA